MVAVEDFWLNGQFPVLPVLYLHDATSADTGTLPAATVSAGATAPDGIAVGGGVNRAMDTTIGSSQASGSVSQNPLTATNGRLLRRWVSDPLAAGVAFNNTTNWTLALASSETPATSGQNFGWILLVWRPSTGARVGTLYDSASIGGGDMFDPPTTETAVSQSFRPLTAVTAITGDILIFELWAGVPAITGSVTVYYDGTTEGSSTSNAAVLKPPYMLTFQAPSGGATTRLLSLTGVGV